MRLGKIIFSIFIEAYRYLVSPLIHLLAGPGYGCRFHPTCSRYASEAVQVFGVFKGGALTIKRVCRCHPFSKSFGEDPVPKKIIFGR